MGGPAAPRAREEPGEKRHRSHPPQGIPNSGLSDHRVHGGLPGRRARARGEGALRCEHPAFHAPGSLPDGWGQVSRLRPVRQRHPRRHRRGQDRAHPDRVRRHRRVRRRAQAYRARRRQEEPATHVQEGRRGPLRSLRGRSLDVHEPRPLPEQVGEAPLPPVQPGTRRRGRQPGRARGRVPDPLPLGHRPPARQLAVHLRSLRLRGGRGQAGRERPLAQDGDPDFPALPPVRRGEEGPGRREGARGGAPLPHRALGRLRQDRDHLLGRARPREAPPRGRREDVLQRRGGHRQAVARPEHKEDHLPALQGDGTGRHDRPRREGQRRLRLLKELPAR